MGIKFGSVPPHFLESIIESFFALGAYLVALCLLNKEIKLVPDTANIWPVPESLAIATLSFLAKAITKIGPLIPLLIAVSDHSGKIASGIFFLGPAEKDLLKLIKINVPEAIFPEWSDTAINSGIKGPILVIALAMKLKIAIANDSGTGHMFALSGTNLISLFSKHNATKYAPNAKILSIIDSKDWGGIDPNLIPINAVEKEIENLMGS